MDKNELDINPNQEKQKSNQSQNIIFTYKDFIELLQQPSCIHLVGSIKKYFFFILSFVEVFPRGLNWEESANRIHIFIDTCNQMISKVTK